ncbi:hypothetical protein GP486_005236, partial [Trichoglossum hirsutum]
MDAQRKTKTAVGLKPCIVELVRTQHCPPSIVLLVQMIMAAPAQTPKGLKHGFRMILTDGEKFIQATLVADIHWIIVTEEISVGAFVMLDQYKLAKAMRKNRNGVVAYLQITNLRAVGYVDGYSPSGSAQSSKTSHISGRNAARHLDNAVEYTRPLAKRARPDSKQISSNPRTGDAVEDVEDDAEEAPPPTKNIRLDAGTTGHSNQAPIPCGPDLTTLHNEDILDVESKPLTEVNPNDDKETDFLARSGPNPLPSSLKAFPRNVYRRKIVEHWIRCHRVPFPQLQSPYASGRATRTIANKDQRGSYSVDELTDEQVETSFPQACVSLSQYAIYSIEAGNPLKRIGRPLDIITLKSLAGLAKKQNRICDILAVIETEPSPIIKQYNLPPKRDIKLSDPTTLKRITLSVFVDAEHFTPAIGTICLIRNVRNHRFNGQSLNAYPEDCEGYDWFIPNPDFMVPKGKTEWLREWWEEKLERKRRWNG